jgi:hypothetical protein
VLKNFNAKAKGSFSNFGRKIRSFGAKWVRMVGKINLCKGLLCKKQVLAFKPQIEVKLPYGFKWSVVFK